MTCRCSRRRRGEAGQKGALLVVDAGAVVGDADHLAAVEDGDDDVAEVRVDEVLDELADDRVRHLAALLAAVVVGLLGQRGDERRQVVVLDAHHARRAGERVVDGDAWRRRTAGRRRQLRRRPRRRPLPGHAARSAASAPSTSLVAAAVSAPAAPRSAAPGIGEQPVEERFHGGAEYTSGPDPPRSASTGRGETRMSRRKARLIHRVFTSVESVRGEIRRLAAKCDRCGKAAFSGELAPTDPRRPTAV